ncbi:hypothetical protein ABMA46_07265 [Mesorhizobium sp. CN5-321]|uniref:hypothetical protein n=1 Tax=Mesorhizobium hunchu TaxID=3157708 RepID=UPI0032B7E96E
MSNSPTSIRFPEDLKQWAETRSIRNHRSVSAEVVAILTAVREGEETGSGFERFANPSGTPGTVEL